MHCEQVHVLRSPTFGVTAGGLLFGRTLALLLTVTLATSMAARQGPEPMAAHQICSQTWLAASLLADSVALAAQVCAAWREGRRSLGQWQRGVCICTLRLQPESGIGASLGLNSFGKVCFCSVLQHT